ncbi:L-2-hydroxyglutarate oxidase [Lignipirellula cremea]|uniref:L-2-hydroxyglutarate oxidase LhgO n=1 Tax=Lignipirellula cremea TaxID=2528010 RepID=A0A518DPZ3_9BACT|nr:L-2-hydroxyglutarate oxidase [Lignipirellula cremea]QDU93910.1 L-2-hydroxyglutarate oxidase LhgO [Lignipirellula cremea]
MQTVDIAVVGGGIVGLATAWHATQRFPQAKVVVLEKETAVAAHQTGHNSGVLHTGIYYKPGSLKAINCREGKLAMQQFCEQQGVDFDICGKVIVALNEQELGPLQTIFERGQANGVRCEMIPRERLLELEPHAAGIQAIHVPEAGIVNYRQVCQRLAAIVRERGGEVVLGARVLSMEHRDGGVVLQTKQSDFTARQVVNCAGLQCDRVARLSGQKPAAKIVPFRGEYYELKPEAQHLCRTLIYPTPDPSFPFLGVHFTRMIEGGVECGPNAVLAFAREGYRKRDINLRDLAESLTYPGFLKMAMKHWRTGLGEMWRSFSKQAFVHALQRLLPEIRAEHLVKAPAGVRAQAVTREGKMVDDFLILETERVINVNNAPSPAATASLNIGRLIVDKLSAHLS